MQSDRGGEKGGAGLSRRRTGERGGWEGFRERWVRDGESAKKKGACT